MSKTAQCVSCRFGQCAVAVYPGWPGGLWTKPVPEEKHDIVLCKLNPRQIEKKPTDWCGQHQPRSPEERQP